MPFLLFLLFVAAPPLAEAACTPGCPLALGSYYLSSAADMGGVVPILFFVANLFNTTLPALPPYNPYLDSIDIGYRVNVFFPCSCFSNRYLAANFPYRTAQGDTYTSISSNIFANLTSADALADVNSYSSTRIPTGVYINVTVNCSCGDASVSEDYGLFETYPLREGDSLSSVAAEFNLSGEQSLLQRYNHGVNFNKGGGIVFVPARGVWRAEAFRGRARAGDVPAARHRVVSASVLLRVVSAFSVVDASGSKDRRGDRQYKIQMEAIPPFSNPFSNTNLVWLSLFLLTLLVFITINLKLVTRWFIRRSMRSYYSVPCYKQEVQLG